MSKKAMPTPLPCPFCGGKAVVWHGKRLLYAHCMACGANGPMMGDEKSAIAWWNDRAGDGSLRHDLARAELMHKRTAEHLREERRRRRAAEADLADAEDHLRMWLGPETGYSIQRTPEHYRGDGFVTCARAMESAAAQETVCERPPMALWWWLCALKYVWRMWSKEDPRRDGQKAIDCIRKALAEIGERG